MNLATHAWLNFRHSSLRQARLTLVIVVLLGCAALVTQAFLAARAQASIDRVDQGTRLNYVVVDQDDGHGDQPDLDEAAVARIRGLDHVKAVHGWSQAGLLADDDALSTRLPQPVWAASEVPGVPPTTTAFDGTPRALRSGEILLPDSWSGRSTKDLLGRTVALTYQRKVRSGEVEGVPVKLRVAGLFDSSAPNNDGPDTAYVNDADARTWEAANATGSTGRVTIPRSRVYVEADSRADVGEVQKELTTAGFSSTSEADAVSMIDPLSADLASASTLLVVVLILAFLVMGIQFGSIVSHHRRAEIGVMKSFGTSTGGAIGLVLLESVFMALALFTAMVVLAALVIAALGLLAACGVPLAGFRLSGGMLATMIHHGAWFPLVILLAVPLGSLPMTIRTARSVAPYDVIRGNA